MKRYGSTLLAAILLGSGFAQADRVKVVPRGGGESRQESSRSGGSGGYRRAPRELPVAGNRGFERTVVRRAERVRVVPNRYYWNDYRGQRYAHLYRDGAHWYGFYNGPRFYWTRYHRNRWWWYDPTFTHWSFWWGGYWWWAAPGGVYYVYVNDAYRPYESAGVEVAPPTDAMDEDPPSGTPPGPAEDTTVHSSDGKRMVQIAGEEDSAFLYDSSGSQPVFMKVLGKGVANARFSGGTDGKPVQILINYQDGHFELFNATGDPAKVQ